MNVILIGKLHKQLKSNTQKNTSQVIIDNITMLGSFRGAKECNSNYE